MYSFGWSEHEKAQSGSKEGEKKETFDCDSNFVQSIILTTDIHTILYLSFRWFRVNISMWFSIENGAHRAKSIEPNVE